MRVNRPNGRNAAERSSSNVLTRIRERRGAGRVTCDAQPIAQRAAPTALADRAVEAHGLRGLGDAWLEISAHDALIIAASVLHRDLAHGTEVMPHADAVELATDFLDFAQEPHRYFTNGEWVEGFADDGSLSTAVAWDPISNATVDAGVICVGDDVTSILWVEDDD